MSPCLTPPPAPAVRVARQSLRMVLTGFTAIGLSGCSGFFESVASLFGGEVDTTVPVAARDEALPVPPPKPVREEFCYREAQYLQMLPQECHYHGGRMVSVRGGLEALRNRQIGRPDVAPVPQVEIVTAGAAGTAGMVAATPAGPAMLHPAAAAGAGAAGRPGIRATGPAAMGTLAGTPASHTLSGHTLSGRATTAPAGAMIGRCYREYRYLDFDPEDCFELGGVVVDDSFVPGPQPLHKIRPGVPIGPVSNSGMPDTAGPVVRTGPMADTAPAVDPAAARLDPRAAGYLSSPPPRAAGPVVHRPLSGPDLRAAPGPAVTGPAATPVSAYRLQQDVWRCRLGPQLLRLSIEDCAAAGGSMSRGDVMEDMHGIAMPADTDVPVAGDRLVARLAPARARPTSTLPDRMPATGARRDTPAPASGTLVSVPAIEVPAIEVPVAALPAIPLPRPAVDDPATVPAPTTAATAPAIDGPAEAVATALPVPGAASLWPAPQHRLVNRTADKWDVMPPASDAGRPAGTDATGPGGDPRPARQFCFRNGQHLLLGPADCVEAGGITVIGRRGPVAAPIMPAIPPAASADSAPLVTPLRLNQLIAAR